MKHSEKGMLEIEKDCHNKKKYGVSVKLMWEYAHQRQDAVAEKKFEIVSVVEEPS